MKQIDKILQAQRIKEIKKIMQKIYMQFGMSF